MVVDVVCVFGLFDGLELMIDICCLGIYGKCKMFDVLLYVCDWIEILGLLIVDLKIVCWWCVQKVWVIGMCEGLKWLCNEVLFKDDVFE